MFRRVSAALLLLAAATATGFAEAPSGWDPGIKRKVFADGKVFDYRYQPDGSRHIYHGTLHIATEWSDGTVAAYGHNKTGVRLETRLTQPGKPPRVYRDLPGFSYQLFPNGLRLVFKGKLLSAKEHFDGTLETYAYDRQGRQLERRLTKPGQKPRVFRPVTPAVRAALSQGGAEAPAAGEIEYRYDENGNLVMKAGEASYTFNSRDLLTRVARLDGTVVEHTYNGDGHRVRTVLTKPGQAPDVTNYLIDPTGSLPHVVAETDGNGDPKAYYVRSGDELLEIIRPDGQGGWDRKAVHADAVGSVRAFTDESGQVTDRYEYTGFGELLAHQGSDPQPYAFAGEPLDRDSGFQYHRARWMDPRTGRFASMDPFRGGRHPYWYAANAPIDMVDATGFFETVATLSTSFSMMSSVNGMATTGQLGWLSAGFGSGQGKKVYLTFDDGPYAPSTRDVLAGLRGSRRAKATFFLMGRNVERHADIVTDIAADNHRIGNHSYSHWATNTEYSRRSPQDYATDFRRAAATHPRMQETLIGRLPGNWPQWKPRHAAAVEAALGLTLIGWTTEVSQGDAASKSVERIVDDIITKGGAAPNVLFHDLHWEGRSSKLTSVVDGLRIRGYEPDVLP